MAKTIRIGTRHSELALWQANHVKNLLEKQGYETVLITVKSTGDLVLDKPLYELGITGIFTKALDVAMINGEVDIAVHSMKDVPTALPKGIVQAAVLERANVQDILVHKGLDFLNSKGIIATGSLRRKAQWLHRYPDHNVVNLRGNVNSRLRKLDDSHWNGAIFAAAGLERIGLKPDNHIDLKWMIPAPAQGTMMVAAMENDDLCREALSKINHQPTEICTHVEREFLRDLEGGCTAPIGANATIEDDKVTLYGGLFSLDGKEKIIADKRFPLTMAKDAGKICAMDVLENGGKELMAGIKLEMNKAK